MDKINPDETICYLLGISKNSAEELHDLPAADFNINKLSDLLIREHNFSSLNVMVRNHFTRMDSLRIEIREIMDRKEIKNFLFYFSGHGAKNSKDEFALILKDTPLDDLLVQGLSPKFLFETITSKNPNINIIIILDCCFSQSGFKEFKSNSQYIIVSSQEEIESIYPKGKNYSVFTEELINILKFGILEKGEYLSLEEIFEHLRIRIEIQDSSHPKPEKSTSGNLGRIPFFRNKSFGVKNISKFSDGDMTALNRIFDSIVGYKQEFKAKGFESIEEKKKAVLGEYPYPLAYHLNHLIPKNGILIKSELETCYHRTLEFTCFVFLSQLLAIQPRNEKEQNEELLTLVVNQNENNLYVIINLIASILTQYNHSELIFDESQLWIKSLRGNFERIGKCLSDKDCDLDVAYKFLIELYSQLTFFSKYLLFSVRLIDVNFRKYHDKPIYIHEASLLEGERLATYTKEIHIQNLKTPKKLSLNWEIYKNSNSVLLTSYEDIELKKYLNLWPFVIDCTVYERKDDNIMYIPEIRMFAGKKGGQYLYKGVEFDPNNPEKAFRNIDVISSETERTNLCERFEIDLKMHGFQAK